LSLAGAAGERVAVAGFCTSCNASRFYSYRSSGGKTGRFAMFAQIVG
jgi:copper oxidase (laccase) domain-containing protein